jgi:hypothetical protein
LTPPLLDLLLDVRLVRQGGQLGKLTLAEERQTQGGCVFRIAYKYSATVARRVHELCSAGKFQCPGAGGPGCRPWTVYLT